MYDIKEGKTNMETGWQPEMCLLGQAWLVREGGEPPPTPPGPAYLLRRGSCARYADCPGFLAVNLTDAVSSKYDQGCPGGKQTNYQFTSFQGVKVVRCSEHVVLVARAVLQCEVRQASTRVIVVFEWVEMVVRMSQTAGSVPTARRSSYESLRSCFPSFLVLRKWLR
jgi:hypothetical protein